MVVLLVAVVVGSSRGVDRSRINCIFRREAAEEEGDEGELERLRKGKYIPSRRIVHLGEQLHSIYISYIMKCLNPI